MLCYLHFRKTLGALCFLEHWNQLYWVFPSHYQPDNACFGSILLLKFQKPNTFTTHNSFYEENVIRKYLAFNIHFNEKPSAIRPHPYMAVYSNLASLLGRIMLWSTKDQNQGPSFLLSIKGRVHSHRLRGVK